MRRTSLFILLIGTLALCSCGTTTPPISDNNTNPSSQIEVDADNEISTETDNSISEDTIIVTESPKDYSIPEEFCDYTKFIGENISVLGVDTSEWNYNEFTHDLWKGSFYGRTGTISVQLGWDDETIVRFFLGLDDEYKIQDDEFPLINETLNDKFGNIVEETGISYNYSGNDDFEFQLPKTLQQQSVCTLGWNTEKMLAYMSTKPKPEVTEEPQKEEPIEQKKNPTIGMTADEVRNSTWGEPDDINKTTNKYGVREQWVYKSYNYDNRYIYLENGIVTTIQE